MTLESCQMSDLGEAGYPKHSSTGKKATGHPRVGGGVSCINACPKSMMRTELSDEWSRPDSDAAETTFTGACLEREPSCNLRSSAWMGPRSCRRSVSEMDSIPGRLKTTLEGV